MAKNKDANRQREVGASFWTFPVHSSANKYVRVEVTQLEYCYRYFLAAAAAVTPDTATTTTTAEKWASAAFALFNMQLMKWMSNNFVDFMTLGSAIYLAVSLRGTSVLFYGSIVQNSCVH